jgi:UDP-N-acetylmuramate--alanine ligase
MVYFIGAGGIGMSALARYFNIYGKRVAGYDLTRTRLTDKLVEEGVEISYIDDEKSIPACYTDESLKEKILIVYTPAIPGKNRILQYFISNGYNVVKRAKLLGDLVNERKGIAVAGTHGKTSVCTLIAHLLMQSPPGCNAFLGGVAKNYNSNLLVSEGSDLFIVEADEYDRSFLQLRPHIAVITSMDPDHLDIYGNFDEMAKGYYTFAGRVKAGGTIICKDKLGLKAGMVKDAKLVKYGLDKKAGYFAANIRISVGGFPIFDLVTPSGKFCDLKLGVPGRFNVENAVAAVAVALSCGMTEEKIRTGLENFQGIYRRFDLLINTPDCVLIDDYAHHPVELRAAISAVREIFPDRKITGIFQPHLYTRTRDFAVEFAESLNALDELILLDIYPAREDPVPGITSELIFNKVKLENKKLCSMQQLPAIIEKMHTDVVITLGAGNIDTMVEPVKNILLEKSKGRL